jgi:dihydroorotase
MKTLIQGGRVIDPASGFEQTADVAIAAGRIVAIGSIPAGFAPAKVIDASGCIVAPGLVDLSVRLREPGHEHAGMLESELAASVAGGVTSLVCPPDTDPVLDEPGLVDMLKFRAEKLHKSRVFPLGALTRGLHGAELTEMAELTESGCVGFSQAEQPITNTLVLLRALQYAATFGYTTWLRAQDAHLGTGVAASGALATRLGLSGVPVAAETVALHTIFELMRATGARVHICRISSAAGVALVRAAKAEGLPVTCDVSVHNLHLIDHDIGYFDSRLRLSPPVRQQRDRQALAQALADGTIDALVSDHTPVTDDEKNLPFGEATPGASAVELLLSLSLKWAQSSADAAGLPLNHSAALAPVTSKPAQVLASAVGTLGESLGRLVVGGVADVCVFDPDAQWRVEAGSLVSQSTLTPFAYDLSGMMLPGRVRCTVAQGYVAFEATQAA